MLGRLTMNVRDSQAQIDHAVDVFGQQRVPETAPDDFGHVPLSTAEHAFEFLDNLAAYAK